MKPYPLMINLEGKQVVVVGGGRVASRKVKGLLESGARVAVISPRLEADLEQFLIDGQLEWISENFEDSLLDRFPEISLLFGTTNHREVNIQVYQSAIKRKIPCNVADMPDLCTFIVPAVITQGDLMIAISTGGSSPALARKIREELEKNYGPEYAEMTRVMGELRKLILQTGKPSDENKKVFLEIVDSEILTALKENDRERALEILRAILPKNIDPTQAMQKEFST